MRLKQILHAMALGLALAGLVIWLARGAHRGWTQTTVPVTFHDDVTGLEGIRYDRKFVPGLDFLGLILLGSGLLSGTAMAMRRQSRQVPQPQP
jgi:hypothetical protein